MLREDSQQGESHVSDGSSRVGDAALDARLQRLLDRQDRGQILTTEEREEAEGLVDLAELLTLLRLRAERAARRA
jgi:hypothetical protein